MSNPFFSIIIPTYNSAGTLAICLNRIACQTFKNFEVIVVDGASSDATLTIANKYRSQLPRLNIVSEVDRGIYDAMNKGAKMANGEWIYFLGSDDMLNNDSVLARTATSIIKGYDVLYGNVKITGDTAWAKNGDIYDGEFDLPKLLQKNICHQATFYSRRCFEVKGPHFKIEYQLCSDWDFNLRCWAKKPFLYMDLLVADFCGGGATTVSSNDALFFNDFEENLLKYFGNNFRNNIDAFRYPQKSLSRFLKTMRNKIRSQLPGFNSRGTINN
jgi:glycosyltransferase involved in cell wall biosynthesis